MKKRSKIILGISIPLILLTGGMMMTQRTPFDIFLTKDFTKPTKEQQIDYLKKHEQEMTEFVKSQNRRITSVTYDWDSVDVGIIGNGTPQGAGKLLTFFGKFNGNVHSSFRLDIPIDKNGFTDLKHMYLGQPFRVEGDIFYDK